MELFEYTKEQESSQSSGSSWRIETEEKQGVFIGQEDHSFGMKRFNAELKQMWPHSIKKKLFSHQDNT